jgi:shikimate 5-dehydrogenase
VIYNRTLERALGLKQRCPNIIVCTNIEELKLHESEAKNQIESNEIEAIIGTIPANNELCFGKKVFEHSPVIFDVAYKTRITPLLKAVSWEYKILIVFRPWKINVLD